MKKLVKRAGWLLYVSALLSIAALGQSTFSGTGNWSTPARWSNGIPGSGTAVTIAAGANCTVDIAANCASLAFAAVTSSSVVTISGTNTLTVTGAVSMPRPSTGQTCTLAVGAGTLSSGSLTMSATTGARSDNLTISTGTVSITGAITTGTTGCLITFTGAGTLNIGGSFSSTPTLTTFAGSTVNYNAAGAQTALVATYNNLTLSGSGVKTFATTPTVNGVLSMEGTATITVTTGVVTYGANATLQYNTATARTSSAEEWITPFAATGGVIIANTGAITIDAAKVFNTSVPLTINNGATLNTSAANNYSLTFGGNFVNNGGTLTGNASAIIITGTVTQSIGSFTTTGTVSMTKTGGTATFTGSENGGALTINGSGGTLNLGASLTHTFTGVVTLTAGTLNGGSSILNENAVSATAWNGTGTVFTAGTGTVNFGAAGNQTLSASATTFNNVTFSGSGTKTLTTANCIINGVVSMEGTATVSAAPTYGASATLQYNTGTARTAGVEWITPFAATGGVIIASTGTITLNAAKVFNASVPLTVDSGATLNTSAANNYSLTFGGNYINNGGTLTANASPIIIANNATQNIAGFTTTGAVSMTKTGGSVATLTGSVNGGALTINGSGCTLNLGTSLTHTFTGVITLTAGTLNGGSSTLNENAVSTTAWNGTGTVFTAGTGTVNFGAAGNQTISSSATTFNNLVFSGTGAKTLSPTIIVNDTATITSVTVTNNGTLTVGMALIGSGGLTQGTNATLNIGGVATVTTLTPTASGNTVNYNGTATDQAVRGGITYYNLQISNGSTKLVQTGNVTISNVLTLNSGILRIGDYNLILSSTATGAIAGSSFSSTTMIQTDGIGYVQKSGGTGGSGLNIVYPVGLGGYYNPLDLTGGFSVTGASTGNIQISTVSLNQGPNALAKYWNLTVAGYTGSITSNLRFTYGAGEVHGSQSQYDTWYYNGTSWVSAPGAHTSLGANPFGSNVSAVTAASISGRWSAGSMAPATSLSYYSYQSGNWSDQTSWTSDPSGTLWINPGVPGTSDNVTILNGRTISVVTNTKQVASLTINSGGILDITSTTGHNFGTVTGQGKFMLSSNTFPGGTFTSFVSSGGGTIEYYNLNNVSLSTSQMTYNNLIISNYTGSSINSYLSNFSNPTAYTINGNFNIKNYSTGSETFYFGNPTPSSNLINMTVYGNFTVDAGCSILVNNFAGSQAIPNPTNNTTSYPVHTLSLYGNFVNNGSVRFTGLPSPVNTAYYTLTTTAYGGTNYGDVQVYFKGATNNTVTCNGVTDFFRLIEEKGSDKTYMLEVISSNTNNFALYAPNSQGNSTFNGGPEGYGYGAYYKALFVHYGTLELDQNISIPSLTEGGQDFNVIPTAGLWINGANVSTTVSGLNGTGYQASTLYGSLRISAGQFSTGDAAGIVLGTLGTPVITIEGTGTLDASQAWTATGGSNQMSYIQTGGTANFRMEGEQQTGPMLNLSNVNSVFIMSGGSMNFTDNTFINAATDFQIMDIECQAGNYAVTGGAINLNLPSSATVYTANATVPFYNLNISRRTGTGTVTIQWNTPGTLLTIGNDLTIGANTTLNLSTSAIDLSIGHNFTIATGGTYTPATGAANVTTFNGSGAQAFNNVGTITGNALNNLTISNSSVTSIINNDLTVSKTLTINTGAVLNDSGRYVYVGGNIVNTGTHTGQLGGGGIRVNGTTAQTINGGGTGTFYNLIIDKPNTTGVSLIGNASVVGNLRLVTNANFNIGSNSLLLGPSSNVYTNLTTTAQSYDNTHMVYTNGLPSDGGITKTFDNSHTSFLYPIGTGTSYRPAQVSFTANPTHYGWVEIRPILSAHPLVQAAGKAITLYWKTTSSGFSGIQANSINQVYYYNASDAPNPSDEVNYIPGTYIAPSWTSINDVSKVYDTSTPREIHFDGVTYIDGEFTAGTAAAFAGLMTYFSNSNNAGVTSSTGADWNAANTWCTGSNTGTPVAALPDNESSASFVIGDGSSTTHKINITGVHQITSGNITILSDGVLDIGATSGHNFGPIISSSSGNGVLRIASNNYFPRGDWGDFLGSTGGTVEYYQTSSGTLNLPTTYLLPSGSTANITGYYNLTTSPYNASNIILPNTNLTVYNNFSAGYSSGGGTTNCLTQLNAAATSTALTVQGNLNVNQYGVLQFMNGAAQNVVVNNAISIANGGAFQVRNGGTSVANSLTVYGSIVNNGTFDLDSNYPTNDNYFSNLIFTGTASRYLTSTTTPTRTRLYGVTANIGTSRDSIINVNIDPTGFQIGGGGLNLQNGTFRLTTNVAMNLSTGGFTIPSTACLSANGGTFNIATGAAAADLMLNGRLEVLNGTVNVGPAISSASANAFNIVYASAGTPEVVVSGGALNIYTQLRRGLVVTSGALSYTQSGGTVTIGAKNADPSRAAFEVLNSGSKFVMSSGTLIIANHISTSAPFDLDAEAAVASVTGGTIQFGLAAVTPNQTTFYFNSSNTLNNLTLESTTNAQAIQQIQALHLTGSLTIGGATSYYNANGLDLYIGGNLINNNSNAANGLNVGGYQAQVVSQNTVFNGAADQTITGSGSNRTNFANVQIAPSSTHSVTLAGGTSNITVNGNLTLTSGTLNDGGRAVYLFGSVTNNAAHASSNPTAGGITFIGTSNQTVGGSGTGVFGNIEINNGGNGVTITKNTTINGQCKFTNGYLYLNDFALTLGSSATISGTVNASNMIIMNGVSSDKGVTKIFPSGASSFTFPIGDNGKYTPCTFNFSSNANSGASIKVIPVNAIHPTVNPSNYSNYLSYYWIVSSTGFSSSYNVTHTYTYLATDVQGNPTHIERYDNSLSQWSTVSGTISSPTFSFSSTSLLDGSYTIGDVFNNLPLLTSKQSGNWNDASTWDLGVVPNGNPVVIRAQDSVALNANGAFASSVTIYGVLDAENTTFHSLGQVSGNGKIKILNTGSGIFIFPAGSYDSLFSNPASVVEFYGNTDGTLPLDVGSVTKPYQNVIFSGTGIKYISSVDMKVAGNLTFASGGKLNNSLYNKDLYILGNWSDNNSGTGGFTPGTGGVLFSGTALQYLIMASNSVTETFYNLGINNAAGLTIQTGMASVSNQLILTLGNINTNATNKLTINNTATTAVTGGNINSFVNGPLSKAITNGSSFVFPVGDAVSSSRHRYGYVSVFSTATTGTQIWTAQFFDKNPTTDGYNVANMASPLNWLVTNEYWSVTGPAGGSANVLMGWDAFSGMSSSAPTRAQSVVAEWNTPVASKWNSVGGVVSDFGHDSGTVATSALIALDSHFFTIGSAVIPVGSLIWAIQTGTWNTPTTWNNGVVPGSKDTVAIGSPYPSPVTVTLDIDPAITALKLNSAGTVADAGHTLSVTGNILLDGTWSGSGNINWTSDNDTLSGAGTVNGTATLQVNGNDVVLASASPTLNDVSIAAAKSFTNYGTLGLHTMTGGSGSSSFVNAANSTLKVSGSLMATGTISVSAVPNTVEYNGTGAQTVIALPYSTLRISGTRTTNTVALSSSDTIHVSNAFVPVATFSASGGYQSSGTVFEYNGTSTQNIAAFTYNTLVLKNGNASAKTITGTDSVKGDLVINSGSTVAGGTGSLVLFGNWINNGTFTPASSTVEFGGVPAMAVSGATTFNTLNVNKQDSATAVTLNNNVNVGTLNMLKGTMQTGANSVTITATRTGNALILGTVTHTHAFVLSTPYSFEGPNTLITFTSGSTPTSVTVAVTQTTPANPTMIPVDRSVTISTTGGSFNATLRLHYENSETNNLDETGLSLWEYSGSAWNNMGATSRDTVNNYVELTGVSSFSPWAIGASASTKTFVDNNGGVANAGDTLTYTIKAVNPYKISKPSVNVSDALPSHFILVPSTVSNSGSISGQVLVGKNLTGGSITYPSFSLAGGAFATRTFQVRSDSTISPSQSITNTAQIDFGGGKVENVSVPVTLTNLPNISIANSLDNTKPVPGDLITYTLSIKNNGTANATNITFNTGIPSFTTFSTNAFGAGMGVQVDGVAKTNAADGDGVTVSGSSITITISTIAPGATTQVKFKTTIN
ncbi:MAG TPA: hypothetical protein VMM58_09065 [Bacteroidota bacterium]|nr:hypothetical protein [Bacteroidota bacterium]